MAAVRVRVEAVVVVVVAAVAVAVAVDLVETRHNGVSKRHRANGGKPPDNVHTSAGASTGRDRRPW